MQDVLMQAMNPLLAVGGLDVLAAIKPWVLIVLGFSAVIFVHELGHCVLAKLADVRVEKFCIGFGRELFGFTRGETRYSFNILPLGGYVKMLGQEDFDDKTNEFKFQDDPRSFASKPVGHRAAIVSAGERLRRMKRSVGPATMASSVLNWTNVSAPASTVLPPRE